MNRLDPGAYTAITRRPSAGQGELLSALLSALLSMKAKLAEGIRATADTLDGRALTATQWERTVAGQLHVWSEQIRGWDVGAAEARARARVLERPAASLAVAAVAGLCLGLMLRKS